MGNVFRGWLYGYIREIHSNVRICKDIQLQWNFKIEDYIFDPAEGEARVWFGYPSKE
jgi:hypothetical protein